MHPCAMTLASVCKMMPRTLPAPSASRPASCWRARTRPSTTGLTASRWDGLGTTTTEIRAGGRRHFPLEPLMIGNVGRRPMRTGEGMRALEFGEELDERLAEDIRHEIEPSPMHGADHDVGDAGARRFLDQAVHQRRERIRAFAAEALLRRPFDGKESFELLGRDQLGESCSSRLLRRQLRGLLERLDEPGAKPRLIDMRRLDRRAFLRRCDAASRRPEPIRRKADRRRAKLRSRFAAMLESRSFAYRWPPSAAEGRDRRSDGHSCGRPPRVALLAASRRENSPSLRSESSSSIWKTARQPGSSEFRILAEPCLEPFEILRGCGGKGEVVRRMAKVRSQVRAGEWLSKFEHRWWRHSRSVIVSRDTARSSSMAVFGALDKQLSWDRLGRNRSDYHRIGGHASRFGLRCFRSRTTGPLSSNRGRRHSTADAQCGKVFSVGRPSRADAPLTLGVRSSTASPFHARRSLRASMCWEWGGWRWRAVKDDGSRGGTRRQARARDGRSRRDRPCDRRASPSSRCQALRLRHLGAGPRRFRESASEGGVCEGGCVERGRCRSPLHGAETEFGGLDALVNNAGIAGPTGGVEDIDPAEWRRCIEVGLTGQFLCARRAVPMLKAAGRRIDRQHVVGRRSTRLCVPHAVFLGEIRRDRLHAKPRQGARPRRHTRQCRSSRHCRGSAHGKA